jgi:hypothetical protein
MILIWLEEAQRNFLKNFFTMIKKKDKIELVFQEEDKFFEGYFSPKFLKGKNKVYYILPVSKKKLDRRIKIKLKNCRKKNIKNDYVIEIVNVINKPLLFKKIKYVRKKATIVKRFKDTYKIILLYKD